MAMRLPAAEQADHSARCAVRTYPPTSPPIHIAAIAEEISTSASVKARPRTQPGCNRQFTLTLTQARFFNFRPNRRGPCTLSALAQQAEAVPATEHRLDAM